MAKAIMVQGPMSNVGKSLITAGLCRIFQQDGYKVAPFKSQNMALNSFITADGMEMGRTQVMQAEAAGIAPDVRMNPILLKPTNDVGSQVIVNGEVLGTMSARDYFAFKHKLVPDVMKAFHALSAENDIIVIEGAGSPAEVNLKDEDIVNMGMAKMAKAPVLLVGDIDRGGVFAQLIGTVDLLEAEERQMVKGLIINKFRGDKTILDPGIAILEAKSGIDVVGVAPYLHIEVEDDIAELAPSEARDMLVERLLEYKQYKNAAAALHARFIAEGRMHPRPFGPEACFLNLMPDFLRDVSLDSLALLAARALARREVFLLESEHIAAKPIPVEVHVRAIHQRIRNLKQLRFSQLIADDAPTPLVVVTFLAVLELYKRSMVRVEQSQLFGDIDIEYIEGSGELLLDGDDALTSVGEE